MLFDIFDVDGDDTFNDNELELFLKFVFDIDSSKIDENNDSEVDIAKIINKTNFIEYISELISPSKPSKDDNKTDDTTATNGQETNGQHASSTNGDSSSPIKGENDNDNDTEKEKGDNDDDKPLDNDKEDDNDKDKEDDDETNNSNDEKSSNSNKDDADWEKIPLKNGKNNDESELEFKSIEFLANMSLSQLKDCDNAILLKTVKNLFQNKLYNKNKV